MIAFCASIWIDFATFPNVETSQLLDPRDYTLSSEDGQREFADDVTEATNESRGALLIPAIIFTLLVVSLPAAFVLGWRKNRTGIPRSALAEDNQVLHFPS